MGKKTESGSSLLEIIAVMCIIGILSFSTFALYAKAMNTLRSNYVIQQAFLKANELNTSTVASRHKTIDLKVIESDELSYGFSFKSYEKNGDQIVISVKGSFTDGMCENLKEKIFNQEYQGLKDINIAGEIEKKDGGKNTFSQNLSKKGCPQKTEDVKKTEITSMIFVIDPGFERQKF